MKVEQLMTSPVIPVKSIQMCMRLPVRWVFCGFLLRCYWGTFALKIERWWILAVAALSFSQFLIILSWQDAKFGTIPNLVIVLVALLSLASLRQDDPITSVLSR